jgi:3-oxoacyl-[acyl-carrier protein] reductase
MMTKHDFSGKTVVVTGGTRGIGAAVSRAFFDAGATVVATYSGNDAAAAEFATSFDGDAERIWTVKFDVGNYGAVEKFYRQFDERCERLDVLVNNAGIRRDSVVGMMTAEDWQWVLQVNLTGTFNMSKLAVHRMMQNRYGRIVSITSPSGALGFEGQANYAASKAGQVALAKSLSKEVAKRGITVNCVSPGFIDTDLIADLNPDQVKEYKRSVPMKRFGTPDEVADAVLYLASGAAAYVTGTVLAVTGGLPGA